MKKVRGLKAILASFLVTVALAAPAAVLSSQADEVDAELYFTGVSLEMLPDGTVQAIFEVSVDKALNCNGASFVLDYNPDYFTPSYINSTTHQRNEKFTATTDPSDDGFFAYDTTLYDKGESPFQEEVTYRVVEGYNVIDKTSHYSTVVEGQHTIIMELWLDQEKILKNPPVNEIDKETEKKTLSTLRPLKGVSFGGDTGDKNETAYVINKYDTEIDDTYNVELDKLERVVLGRLSFQVEPDRLDEIARYFPKPEDGSPVKPVEEAERPMDNGAETYLIRTPKVQTVPDQDNWQIGVYWRDPGSTDARTKHYYRDAFSSNETDKMPGAAKRYYELAVDPKQIMKVRPAEKEVTINAYQAFTDGTWGDVAQALRRYSPMASVTYVDGTQENLVIPWGQGGDEYKYTVAVKGENGENGEFQPVTLTDNSTYNPLEGVYQITQYVPGKSIHPIPITVTLTVTPIKLKEVQVEDQVLTYDLNNVVSQVENPSDLHLPEKARLITDIVPGGVSMVMRIPAWTQQNSENSREVSWPTETSSNASTLMNDLKEDSFDPPPASTGESGFDAATMPYWPDDGDNKAISDGDYWKFLKKKNEIWIGEYTFHMSESYGGAVKAGFTKAEIQTAFPWLTVEKDAYTVPDALRQIVTKNNFTNAMEYTASYVSTDVAANGQPELTLSVQRTDKAEMAEDSIFRVWLPNGQELGTGQNNTVWPDDPGNPENKIEAEEWFPKEVVDGETQQNGNYHKEKIDDTANDRFHLITNPGDPETGGEETFPDKRETLRRYINLGGWYKVAVCEDPLTRTWSDPMPVYVKPRPNEYQEHKEYNFVGENAKLFHWPGELTHYVTMPQGTYTAVTDRGVRLYDVGGADPVTLADMQANLKGYGKYLDDKGRPKATTPRYEESYGYHTTYDGSTGAQPGTLYSFQVTPDPADPEPAPGDPRNKPWTPEKEPFQTDPEAILWGESHDIYRYGPDPFYDGAIYPSFGKVTQPTGAGAVPYNVTVRKSEIAPKEVDKRVGITLTSDSPTGITREEPGDMDSRVTLATYDTRKKGYTDRQAYTFKITNVGTEPIYGLAIDGLTDGYVDDRTGGRFELLVPPASFLAPGQSTTFVLTYVYNLGPNGQDGNPGIYRDTLYIISNDHPYAHKEGTNQEKKGDDGSYEYLLDFDAEFEVTDMDTHTVTVVVKPGDLSMGSAGLIVGRQEGTTGVTMNYTVTTRSYAADKQVYVAVYMKDEYELALAPTCVDATGKSIDIPLYEETGVTIPSDMKVYVFTMPSYDTTVTVQFYEPTLSKLRLADIIDFSAGTQEELKPNTDPVAGEDPYEEGKNTYKVWRKSFTEQERTDAKNWRKARPQNPEEDLYLMTAGTAVPKDKDGNKFISTENQYIVVIPYDAKWSQVEARLRRLETHNNYEGDAQNRNITPDVVMHLYDKDIRDTWNLTVDTQDRICNQKGSTGDDTDLTVPPDDPIVPPTAHTSDIFESPEPGDSKYVRITASYEGERRSYYLEIHRAPKDPIATLNYGNSPYGMIMNDVTFHRSTEGETKAAQNAAKAAFLENGYTFNGLPNASVPYWVRKTSGTGPAVSKEAIYWQEAWVHNTQLFEPESLTGFIITHTPDPNNPNQQRPSTSPDPLVYKEEENLDLNDHSFFAVLGKDMKEPGVAEALDSTGRPVNLEDIHARVTVRLLDTAATTQIGRFSGTGEATVDLGVAGRLLRGLPQPGGVEEDTWPRNIITITTKVPGTDEEIITYTQVEHIRPGQYELEYVYSDYDGKDLIVKRPLVILPAVGDVNSDGELDQTDEEVLKNRVADPLGYVAGRWEEIAKGSWAETVYARSNIFKYRVVDVNNDRNVNNIDGNLINKITRSKAKAIRFYNATDYVYSGGTP